MKKMLHPVYLEMIPCLHLFIYQPITCCTHPLLAGISFHVVLDHGAGTSRSLYTRQLKTALCFYCGLLRSIRELCRDLAGRSASTRRQSGARASEAARSKFLMASHLHLLKISAFSTRNLEGLPRQWYTWRHPMAICRSIENSMDSKSSRSGLAREHVQPAI
jgi:hypothetical protein